MKTTLFQAAILISIVLIGCTNQTVTETTTASPEQKQIITEKRTENPSPPLWVVVLGDLSVSTNTERKLNADLHFSPLVRHMKSNSGGRIAYGKIGNFQVAPPLIKAIISYPPDGKPQPVSDSAEFLQRASLLKLYEEQMQEYQEEYNRWLNTEVQPEIDRFYSELLPELENSDRVHKQSNVAAALERAAIFLSAPEIKKASKYILIHSDLVNTTDDVFDGSIMPEDVIIICVYGRVNRKQAEKLNIKITHFMESPEEAVHFILNNERKNK